MTVLYAGLVPYVIIICIPLEQRLMVLVSNDTGALVVTLLFYVGSGGHISVSGLVPKFVQQTISGMTVLYAGLVP